MKYINPKPVAHRSAQSRSTYTTSIRYDNNTGIELVVIGRNGIASCISPAVRTTAEDTLNIYVKVKVYDNASFGAIEHIFSENTEERQELKEAFLESCEHVNIPGQRKRTQGEFEVVYRIDKRDITDNGSVYFDLLDIVVSSERDEDLPLHPRTSECVLDNMANKADENIFNFNMYIVDHSGLFTKRFLRIGDLIYEIPMVTNPTCPDGIYLVTNTKGKYQDVKHYLLYDEKCPLNLYHSKEEARNHGDIDAELERKYKSEAAEQRKMEFELKKQIEQLKIDADKAKMEYEKVTREERTRAEAERLERDIIESKYKEGLERERIQREAEEAKLKRERDAHEAKVKSDRERKSNKSKSVIEWLKAVPPIATVITLFMTIWASRR